MSRAAYRRGSRLVAQAADARMPAAHARADRHAYQAAVDALHTRLARAEHDLRRARRCLAAERLARDQLRARLDAEQRAYAIAVAYLRRLAPPHDAV